MAGNSYIGGELEQDLLYHLFGMQEFVPFSTVTVGLVHADLSGEAGWASYREVNGDGYARVSASVEVTGTGAVRIPDKIEYPTAEGEWTRTGYAGEDYQTVVGYAVFYHNGLAWEGTFSAPVYVGKGRSVSIPAGALTFALNNDVLSDLVIDKWTRLMQGEPWDMYDTPYAALSSTDPGSDGDDITEPSGDGYERQLSLPWPWWARGPAVDRDNLVFSCSGGDWGSLTHLALFSAQTGGNYLMRMPFGLGATYVADGDKIGWNDMGYTVGWGGGGAVA